MRIGIYNRWLATLGGGERETTVFAQALARQHQVDLLTHDAIEPGLIERRLGVALDGVGLRVVPLDPEYAGVIAASAAYDLFANFSHGDLFAPAAGQNLLRVFFPVDPEPTPAAGEQPDGGVLRLVRGFYPPEPQPDGGCFVWTGPRAELELIVERAAPAAASPILELALRGWRPTTGAPAVARVRVESGLEVACRLPADGQVVVCRVRLPRQHVPQETVRVALETTTFVPRKEGAGADGRELGVALAGLRIVDGTWRRRWQRTQIAAAAPTLGDYAAMRARRVLPAAQAYDLLLANSDFTRRWIERRWNLRSTVLYPPVAVEELAPEAKRTLILSVGRFFMGSHNKKHLPMIAAFKTLCDRGLRGWEYHLAGGCDEAIPEQRAYLAEVRAASRGYPIAIHANLPLDELRRLYGAARIFWHATGYGEDEDRAPESFEHFGITTVEAMAAGCVPVAIGRGGQVEIVEDGVSGYLWQTLDALQARTLRLVEAPAEWKRLSAAAEARSRDFDTAHFRRNVEQIVQGWSG